MKKFLNLIKIAKPQQKQININVNYKQTHVTLQGKEGDNLMRLLSEYGNDKFEVFGLCDCQLACTTCSVHVKESDFDKFPEPTDEELDILSCLKEYRPEETRMACQLHLPKDTEEINIELPSEINYTCDIYNVTDSLK